MGRRMILASSLAFRLALQAIMKWINRPSVVSLILVFIAQIALAGGHGSHSSGGTVHVSGYYRKDGTYVHPYDPCTLLSCAR